MVFSHSHVALPALSAWDLEVYQEVMPCDSLWRLITEVLSAVRQQPLRQSSAVQTSPPLLAGGPRTPTQREDLGRAAGLIQFHFHNFLSLKLCTIDAPEVPDPYNREDERHPQLSKVNMDHDKRPVEFPVLV
ncbi:unnamed protein product [Caretta caretta]